MRKYLLLIFIYSLFSIPSIGQEKDDIPLYFTIGMPVFPGGETKLSIYIKENLTYPQSAIDNNIEGKVVVQFAIDTSGRPVDISIKESLDAACDSAAIELIRKMPDWTPADKEYVSEVLTLPIVFRLRDKDNTYNGEKIHYAPDTLPEFPGGTQELWRFLQKNLMWPPEYAEACIQGRVIVRFVVTKEGKIVYPIIIRELDKLLDKEALRVVNLMPDWIPAIHNEERVNAYFTLPIIFTTY